MRIKTGIDALMTVDWSEVQQRLPELVELAASGEDVIITVNGEPKARLTRPPELGAGLKQQGTDRPA